MSQVRAPRLFLPVRLLLAAALLAGVAPCAGAAPPLPGSPLPGSGNPGEPDFFVDVSLLRPDDLARLAAAQFDIAGIDRRRGLAGVVTDLAGLDRLVQMGFSYSIRQEGPNPLNRDKALSDYTDPQEMAVFLDQVAANYPTLAQKVLLEDTLFEGQKVWALKITKNVTQPNDRPTFLFDAQHHAREVMTPEIARDMIDYLTSRYATDSQVRRWVDGINIWVVPIVNPDGAMYVFTTNSNWRKNRNPVCSVDINRNYPFRWASCNGSSGSCTSDTFRGPTPGSEPETQAMLQITDDARALFTLSYHSYGEYILYSYGCDDPDEFEAMDALAQTLNGILENDNGQTGQYATGPIWSTIYGVDGGSCDTQYGQYGSYAYSIEVNSGGFQPDYATWRNISVQRQRVAWKYFLDQTLDGPVIRGRVTDAATGLPLQAQVGVAQVTFTHGEAPRTADPKGFYHWLGKAGNTYTLTFSFPGYCTETREVTVTGGPVVLDIQLARPPAPTSIAAAGNGDSRIDVSWAAVAQAAEYRVLRSLTPGGPYALAGVVPAPGTLFADSPVSGGVTYYYIVRAFDHCESADSPEVSATTGGPCTEPPRFAGLLAVNDAGTATCTQTLAWNPASGYCGGRLTYRVYRSPSAPFTPSAATLIASGLAGTSYSDHGGLASGTTYYYIVRAADAASGTEDGNTLTVAGAPTGVPTLGTWTDNAGDTGAAALALQAPWSVAPTGGKAGPKVYATGNYQDNQCASITTPPLKLSADPKLAFASKYDLETDYDAGVVEIATGPDFTNWTRVTGLDYPDDLANSGNACGIPSSGAKTVFSRSIGTPSYRSVPYRGPLSGYANQTVKLRWRFGTDGGTTGKGWWVDDIRVVNALIPGVCQSGLPPSPKEVSPPESPLLCSPAPGGALTVDFAPGCGTIDNAAYFGRGPIGTGLQWEGSVCALGNTGRATFDPGTPLPGTLLYFVLVGQNRTSESSYGQASSGIERPEAAGLGACDLPQDLTGACP